MTASDALFESNLHGLQLVARGKVRDIYRVDAKRLLILASDRMSAFDVVLPDAIPGKGIVLTAISNFWFKKLEGVIKNHLTGIDPSEVLSDASDQAAVKDRAVVVHDLKPLPVEAVVRGYLIGSGWKDYRSTGAVCGITLPAGLRIADRLPEPIFTPATKAGPGQHDENVGYTHVEALLGPALAEQVRDTALALYQYAAAHALGRGIIVADTKFEFGVDEDGTLTLIDEALTPDSSRFWPRDTYAPGRSPPSFDKQFVRDYLETLDWDKRPPAPRLPPDVIRLTSEKYAEALRRLTA